MMNIAKIELAIIEAERFIGRAKSAHARLKAEAKAANVPDMQALRFTTISKQTAACRRASLDLTRALAELRKP